MNFIYFLFIPPSLSPLPRFSVFGVIPIFCPFDTLGGGRFCFSGVGEGKKLQAGLKDGPSRHPEKVYPGGEDHERRRRGARGGQLRQRLYGESDSRRRPYLAPGAPAASLVPPFYNFHPFPPIRTDLRVPAPLLFPSLVSVYSPGGESGAATLPSSFSSRFQALHGGLALSHTAQKAQPATALFNPRGEGGGGEKKRTGTFLCHFFPTDRKAKSVWV